MKREECVFLISVVWLTLKAETHQAGDESQQVAATNFIVWTVEFLVPKFVALACGTKPNLLNFVWHVAATKCCGDKILINQRDCVSVHTGHLSLRWAHNALSLDSTHKAIISSYVAAICRLVCSALKKFRHSTQHPWYTVVKFLEIYCMTEYRDRKQYQFCKVLLVGTKFPSEVEAYILHLQTWHGWEIVNHIIIEILRIKTWF